MLALLAVCTATTHYGVGALAGLHDFLSGIGLPGEVADSRVGASLTKLALTGIFYCWCRFREKPGGIDAGVGDLIVTDWPGPLIAIGVSVAIAATVHVAWRRLRLPRAR